MLKWQFSGRMGGNPERQLWRRFRRRKRNAHAAASGCRFAGRKIAGAMTTLVTGASGFLGSHVARLLTERGEKVRVLLRSTSQTKLIDGLPAERVDGDLRDPVLIWTGLCPACRTVYHVAADYRLWARDPREIYESNVQGTRNLLDAAGARRVAEIRIHQHGGHGSGSARRRAARRDGRDTSLDEMIGAL